MQLPRRRRESDSLFIAAREDPRQFADLYVEYHELVLAFFARRTFDPETAFDLMAETFADAFSSLGSLRAQDDEGGRAWLWAIARHKLYRWRDRGRVERASMQRLGIERAELSAIEFERVEELADLGRVRQQLADALARLGPEQREAVRMRVLDERDYSDIAAVLQVSEQVVRARVSRGLRALAPMLSNEVLVEEGSVS
jgi:RNA polymerase sigma-70 factor (ECF subfamily)